MTIAQNQPKQHYSQSCWPHGSRQFHDLTDTIPLFHRSVPEIVNGGIISGVNLASSIAGMAGS